VHGTGGSGLVHPEGKKKPSMTMSGLVKPFLLF